MNSRGIDQTALSDEFIMKLTRFIVQQLREVLAKCDGNFVNWFNEGYSCGEEIVHITIG